MLPLSSPCVDRPLRGTTGAGERCGIRTFLVKKAFRSNDCTYFTVDFTDPFIFGGYATNVGYLFLVALLTGGTRRAGCEPSKGA